MADVKARMRVRRGTAAQWASANPVLLQGEIGYETDTGALRIGDGSTAFTSLPDRTGIPRAQDDVLSGGYTATEDDDGTVSGGTYQPEPAGGNFKKIVNNGAFTFAAPSTTGAFTMVVCVTNGASAGAITFSGFGATSGDAFSTTNGESFMVFITKVNGIAIAVVAAAQ